MSNFFELSREQQKIVIEQASVRLNNIHPQIVEKDLWVSTILQLIFSLPFSDKLLFKGGTSLSKCWNLIERFSEDIDIAIDRSLFGLEGDLTIKQIKKLRKESSIFVKEVFSSSLKLLLKTHNLENICEVIPESDGVGDKTYPEPRKIFVNYTSLFDKLPYIKSTIVIEVGARSLIEPSKNVRIKTMISDVLPIKTSLLNNEIISAVPEKTFLEKIFLLHELFASGENVEANRKSRHLYDIVQMIDCDFAKPAIFNNELWNLIHNHRQIFTRVRKVDYSVDIRKNITLIPPNEVLEDWRNDFNIMQSSMIYGSSLSFDKLIERINQLCKTIKISSSNSYL